jgi:Domain of unknown function (DUF4397)
VAPKTIRRATASSLAIATLLALLLLAALPATGAAQDTRAMVRVIHLSAGVPKVDLYVDGTRTVAGVPFRTASRYHSLPAGAHTLAIRPAGSAAGSTPLASARASITAGAPYSAVLMGASAQLKAVVAKDDFTAPPAGRAKLRIVDAAPQSPPLDIAVADGPVLFRDVRFGEVSPFIAVAAGRMAMEVRAAGTSRVLFTQGAAPIPAGMIVTLAGTISAAGQIETLPILDAAGAGNLPRGGIATGAGGTAGGQGWSPAWWLLPAVGLLAAVAVAAGRRFRRQVAGSGGALRG